METSYTIRELLLNRHYHDLKSQFPVFFCFSQVSYSPMASDLSNKDKFPLLYSTVPPYAAENAARLAFLRYFRWKRIATIRQNEYVFNEVKHFLPSQVPDVLLELFTEEPSFACWTKTLRKKYKLPHTFL